MSIIPFRGIDRRTASLRVVLLVACFLGMIASRPLWVNSRTFPLLPIFHGFPILPAPTDLWLFNAMLLSLFVAPWFYRSTVSFFLVASFVTFLQDQNRGQPWFYMYWVMLLFTLLPAAASIAACRCAVCIVYFWGGIQKCNAKFFQIEPARFVAPAHRWHLPAPVIDVLRISVAAAPFVEIAIALGLWIAGLRRLAIGAALILHLMALLFLGPLGSNFNLVVWPWNFAMIGLVCVLFIEAALWQKVIAPHSSLPSETPKADQNKPAASQKAKPKAGANPARQSKSKAPVRIRFSQAFADLRCSKPGLIAVTVLALLPAFSFAGLWDSYFSFSLYSQSEASANIFVTESFRDRLPSNLRAYVHPFPPPFDPAHQGSLYFGFEAWCYEETHVPPIPEPRNFRTIFTALRPWSRDPGDLRMIVGPRSGQVFFYEGDRFELLSRQ